MVVNYKREIKFDIAATRDVKVSRPCWSRDRKLWSRSRSRTIRSRSHEDVGLGLTHVGLVVSK